MNTQHFTENGNQKFPLTTQALEFMQQQIFLAYQFSAAIGQNIILRQSSATTQGLVIFYNELLPLTGTPAQYIQVVQNTEQLIVEGKYAGNIRTTRTAQYTDTPTGQYKLASEFNTIQNLNQITQQLTQLQQHKLPAGTIIDWSGTCNAQQIPYGFVPCGQFGNQLTTDQQLDDEIQAWRQLYGNAITITRTGTDNKYIRIQQVNGITVPDLTDRFIVQAGHNYNLHDTGGTDQHQLTIAELPAHNHTLNVYNDDWSGAGGSGSGPGLLGTDSPTRNEVNTYNGQPIINQTGSNTPHENRPPYYALVKLIKIIR